MPLWGGRSRRIISQTGSLAPCPGKSLIAGTGRQGLTHLTFMA